MCLKKIIAKQRGRPTWFFKNKMKKIFDSENEKQNDFVLSLLDIQPTDNILEVGYGSGRAIKKIADTITSGSIFGIDHSKAMFEEAKKLNRDKIKLDKVHLDLGDVTEMKYDDNTFDKVFAVYVIYFWEDTLKALKEVNRVLKPNGKLIVYLSTKDTLEKISFAKTGNFKMFTEPELEGLFKKSGFKNFSIEKRNFKKDEIGMAVIGYKA